MKISNLIVNFVRGGIAAVKSQPKLNPIKPDAFSYSDERDALAIGIQAPIKISVAPPERESRINKALYRASPIAANILAHRRFGSESPDFAHLPFNNQEILDAVRAQLLHDISRKS